MAGEEHMKELIQQLQLMGEVRLCMYMYLRSASWWRLRIKVRETSVAIRTGEACMCFMLLIEELASATTI